MSSGSGQAGRPPASLRRGQHLINRLFPKPPGSARCVRFGPTGKARAVEVDDRGSICSVDRANTGLHVLELTGAPRRVANFP
jgi:hypothetical protein